MKETEEYSKAKKTILSFVERSCTRLTSKVNPEEGLSFNGKLKIANNGIGEIKNNTTVYTDTLSMNLSEDEAKDLKQFAINLLGSYDFSRLLSDSK